jgi:hypothetical protein
LEACCFLQAGAKIGFDVEELKDCWKKIPESVGSPQLAVLSHSHQDINRLKVNGALKNNQSNKAGGCHTS